MTLNQFTYNIPGVVNTFTKEIKKDSGSWNKIGIQAPQGTNFKINGNINIVIGRFNVFEIEGVEITSVNLADWTNLPEDLYIIIDLADVPLKTGGVE